MLEAVRYVDLVIPENLWEQKRNDVLEYKIDTVVMGSDWEGNENFECLKDICEVIYLPRTEGISTTKIKKDLGLKDNQKLMKINEIEKNINLKNDTNKTKKILLLILVLIGCITIFCFSEFAAGESTKQTRGVTYNILKVLNGNKLTEKEIRNLRKKV